MKATKFDPMTRTENGYRSNVMNGHAVVIYRTITKGGQYRPVKYVTGTDHTYSMHRDRVELSGHSGDGETVNIAIDNDTILKLAADITERRRIDNPSSIREDFMAKFSEAAERLSEGEAACDVMDYIQTCAEKAFNELGE